MDQNLLLFKELDKMQIELIIMGGAILLAIIGLLSSRLVRTICVESILHPRDGCKLEVCNGKVTVNQEDAKP